ncbi:hypothetical protein SOVF_016010 [Spinacia oleracea]|nr:hypothetical protein SOVF_016010 [Spinacia oleracea]
MGTLNRGVPLMIQQGNALVKKNLWLAMRSKYSSLLQLFAPFIFLLFLFAVDKSRRHPSTSPELRNPPVINTPSSIPPCETKFHIRRPCFDFVWSGNTSLKAHDIVSRIMANNPGRTIPPYKVRSFGTPDEVDAWLYNDPLRCPVALHFVEKTGSVMGYGIQTNYTTTSIRGKSENPTLQFQIPLQIAAERELARSVLADQSFSWTVRLKELPHHAETLGYNSSGLEFLAPLFLFTIAMFPFVFQVTSIVLEKEMKLRQITAIVSGASKKSRMLYFLPPCLLSHALQMLVTATGSDNSPGISWSNRAKCPTGDSDCYYTMNDIYMRLIYTFVCWFLLALYFDNVIPSNNGTKKSLLYFLNPRYWVGIEGNRTSGGICDCFHSESALDNITPGDVDVLEEENDVKQSMRSDEIDPNIAVQIRGLVKTYPGKLNFGCCCKCYKTDPFHAIKGLYINLPQDELFCLLGPNGAGKTTAINCLTGITSVTAGDAIIYRNSIRSSVGMSNIRKLIGVCPQFDVLWNELTGEENLQLFARIKGLQPASITEAVKHSLEGARLTNSAKVRAGSYSGGMRRRLSVASALLGDPKLVILDEPTTGMDPISRRHVWDIIENAKRGRVVILTTHSMEEADILGDRLGIMAKGRLRCIGTSIRLKTRFGTGFSANLSLKNDNSAENSAHKETVKEFFRHVPVGARYVAIPGSETAENPRGIMVEVHWEQNDSGALCISGHSTERPVPPNVQPSLPVAHPRSLGKPEGTVGRVIDPSQLSDTSFHS